MTFYLDSPDSSGSYLYLYPDVSLSGQISKEIDRANSPPRRLPAHCRICQRFMRETYTQVKNRRIVSFRMPAFRTFVCDSHANGHTFILELNQCVLFPDREIPHPAVCETTEYCEACGHISENECHVEI